MLHIVLTCIVVVTVYWLWSRRETKPDEPPYLPGAWPLLGHIPHVTLDTCNLWTYMKMAADGIHSLGGVVRFAIGPTTIYVVSDPNDMLTVSNNCVDRPFAYDFGKPWIGDGLITASGIVWKKHRKYLNPAFNQSVLDTFMDVFNIEARKIVKNLKKEVGKGLFDQEFYTNQCILETICYTSFGTDVNDSLLKHNYAENMKLILNYLFERLLKFWWHSPQIFRFSKLKKKQDSCIKILHNFSNTIIQRRKYDNQNKGPRSEESSVKGRNMKPFIDILLELWQQGVFSDTQVRQETDTFIAAGTATMSKTLTYIMLLLGAHPAVQEKVLAELKEVFGDEDRDVLKKDLTQLVYLEAVIKETLRLYPVIPIAARQINKDIRLRNCTLYAGSLCALLYLGALQDPSWGPDRHQFRPERWLDPSQLPENPNAFCLFGIGKRTCIGQVYTYMFLKTVLCHLVRNYKISGDISQLRLKLDTTLTPESGHFISLENRI